MSNATAAAEIGDYAQINISSQERPENDGTFWSLEGYDRIQLPRMGRILQENQTSQDLLLPEELAVYSRGMPIQGKIEFSREQVPLEIPSEPGINVCIAPLSLAVYLAGDLANVQLSEEAICTEAVAMDGAENDGAAKKANLSFSIASDRTAERRSGLYALYALDGNRSSIAPAQAFILTEGAAVLQMEDSIPSENEFIKINLSTGMEDNRTKIFAAAIMPRKEYDNATMRLVANESKTWPVVALSIGNRSTEIEVNPATAQDQLMGMISLLPDNSAISMQEAAQSSVDLIFLTDGSWVKGEYVIVCAIYSPEVGLKGLKQKIVEVI
ncbi:hypothetical protein [Methanothrix sp.]|uniref:hypothetical protein n=1 Tax=Methanothrix sp. TaxID=90426 RepID=UPI00329702B6